jgi:CheY-like chemotaxis protein
VSEDPRKETKKNKSIDILLVEDNEADVKITLRAFEKANLTHKIYVARDGQEALDFVRNQGNFQDKDKYPKPDLILLDIKMPKVDGFGVLKELKSDLNYSYIPIIILTSSKNEEDIMRSYQGGAASFIPKPVKYEDFLEVVSIINSYWNIISKLPNMNHWKKEP